jgi:hypothetical protein
MPILPSAPDGYKVCSRCKQTRPLSDFARSKAHSQGRFAYCKPCFTEYSRSHVKAISWRKHYGISQDEYWRLYEAQGGVCAICGQPETRIHKGTPAHMQVDHDHETGAIRGLLCGSCNTALGRFRDNPGLLQRALDYLRRW